MATQSRPYSGSLISVTNKGEVCIFDHTASERSGLDAIEKRTQEDCQYTQSVLVSSRPLPIIHSLENGFSADSSLFCQVRMQVQTYSERNLVLHILGTYPNNHSPIFILFPISFQSSVITYSGRIYKSNNFTKKKYLKFGRDADMQDWVSVTAPIGAYFLSQISSNPTKQICGKKYNICHF